MTEIENLPEEPVGLTDEPGTEPVAPQPFVPCEIASVEVHLPSTVPVVTLAEIDFPHRQLSIAIGLPEGIAIANGLSALKTPKPLTHELMANLIESLGAVLEAVRITDRIGDAFFAEIVLTGPIGIRQIECRPSDAMALALRHRLPVPITVAAALLDPIASA